jgi:ribonuclease HI
MPWGFFDGASKGHPPIYRAGKLLYLSKSHYYTIIYVMGTRSNNKVELVALWDLLFHVEMINLHKLHVFGDSQLVVDCINRKVTFQACRLQPLMN